MPRIGGHQKPVFELTAQRFLAHHPQHPLVIDAPAVALQGMGYAAIAVAWKFQRDTFNGVAQVQVAFRQRIRRRMRVVPTATDAKQATESAQ
jgi:hypothetical protein